MSRNPPSAEPHDLRVSSTPGVALRHHSRRLRHYLAADPAQKLRSARRHRTRVHIGLWAMADGESRSAVLQTISQPGARGAAWTSDDAREGRRVRRVACVGRSSPEAREGEGRARSAPYLRLPTPYPALSAPAAPPCSPTILPKHTSLPQSKGRKGPHANCNILPPRKGGRDPPRKGG